MHYKNQNYSLRQGLQDKDNELTEIKKAIALSLSADEPDAMSAKQQ
jgi:hypothetical protein